MRGHPQYQSFLSEVEGHPREESFLRRIKDIVEPSTPERMEQVAYRSLKRALRRLNGDWERLRFLVEQLAFGLSPKGGSRPSKRGASFKRRQAPSYTARHEVLAGVALAWFSAASAQEVAVARPQDPLEAPFPGSACFWIQDAPGVLGEEVGDGSGMPICLPTPAPSLVSVWDPFTENPLHPLPRAPVRGEEGALLPPGGLRDLAPP